MCGHDFWHGGQAGRHLGQVDRSRSRGRKMFIWMFHWLLIAYSMDLLKKKLRNTTGGNKTWGVFKAYVVFFVTTQGEQKCIKGVHSENTSRSLKCTLSIHFTTERCCERCGKTYFKVYSPPQLWKLWAWNYQFLPTHCLSFIWNIEFKSLKYTCTLLQQAKSTYFSFFRP